MSDGLSDAAAYEREFREHWQYLMALATHLSVGTQDTLNALHNTAVNEEKADQQVKLLKEQDLQAWAKFMIDCRENNNEAYKRALHLVPWKPSLSIRRVEFSRFDNEGKFWRPLFDKQGYGTDQSNGTIDGYDSYAILYDDTMTLNEIVKSSIWLGYKITGFYPGSKDQAPTTPWKKDRKKS